MRGTGGWTLVYAASRGSVGLRTQFDPSRLVTRDARCTPAPDTARSRS